MRNQGPTQPGPIPGLRLHRCRDTLNNKGSWETISSPGFLILSQNGLWLKDAGSHQHWCCLIRKTVWFRFTQSARPRVYFSIFTHYTGTIVTQGFDPTLHFDFSHMNETLFEGRAQHQSENSVTVDCRGSSLFKFLCLSNISEASQEQRSPPLNTSCWFLFQMQNSWKTCPIWCNHVDLRRHKCFFLTPFKNQYLLQIGWGTLLPAGSQTVKISAQKNVNKMFLMNLGSHG